MTYTRDKESLIATGSFGQNGSDELVFSILWNQHTTGYETIRRKAINIASVFASNNLNQSESHSTALGGSCVIS